MNKLTVGGIHIRIHLLFWAVIGLSLATGYFIETITLFGIVIIHEIGHIAVAKELGWQVTEVQLLPFGGVATVEENGMAEPLDEIVVALAGPFMNVVMLFASLVFWWLGFWTVEWTQFFMKSNMLIAAFNLLPIWPLDGGRIVQAVLSYGLPYRSAVVISLGLSCFLASIMIGLGVFHLNVNLLAVALYLLFISAQALFRFPYTFIRFLMKKWLHCTELTEIRPVRVPPHMTLMEAALRLKKGQYHLFYVQGSHGGFLPEEEVLHALLYEQKQHTPIGQLL